MADHIKVRPDEATWVARAGGAIIAESSAVLELTEGSYPPVMYFPRGDVAMAFLDASETRSTCPHKGEATHFDLVIKSGTVADAAWSYDAPKEGVADIAGHIAFYPDKVTVEKL